MRRFLLFITIFSVVGCCRFKLPEYDAELNRDMASVVKLTGDTNTIYLTDYLPLAM